MRPRTVWIISAIILAALLHDEIATLVILAAVLIPFVLKILGAAHDANTGAYRHYED